MRYYEFATEGVLDSIISGTKQVFNSVIGTLAKLKFGQSVTIDLGDYIQTNVAEDEEPKNLISMIGYYNEYSIAAKLETLFSQAGVKVTTNINTSLQQYADDYREYLLSHINNFRNKSPQQVKTEVARVDNASDIMSEKMYQEIAAANDIKLIDVFINLTGQSREGGSTLGEPGKEDIKIVISKKGVDEIIDTIKASLKLYHAKSKSVNMYNATFPSYLVSVITGQQDTGRGNNAIAAFLEMYPQYKDDIEEVLAITGQWKSIKKDKDRKAANQFITQNQGYQKMIDVLFNKIFADIYPSNKAAINQRLLSRVGLDGADDIYLVFGDERSKMVAVSSRTSPEFKYLYDRLKQSFDIRFIVSGAASCKMVIEFEGEVIASFTLSFKEGATFPHVWDAGKIIKGQKQIDAQAKKS